jgi:UDP-N-acetylmuramoyl-L-alanyl-D-glutamate--2,6-diaminopimelate ligase
MPATRPFAHLLTALPDVPRALHRSDQAITAPVVENAADVQPGGVFVARRGASADGHAYIAQAVAGGAAAIVCERAPASLGLPETVAYAQVADAGAAIGYLASAYHGHPSRRLAVIGVTGTDGKTTTSTLLYHVLNALTGGRTGLISTIAAYIGREQIDTGFHVTTPGAPQVQALLARMVEAGQTHVVLEMTSHGLAQGRLNGVETDAALLTNLTHEHLDYHGTFEAYRDAKRLLFQALGRPRTKPLATVSLVNGDDPHADFFLASPADTRVTYGLGVHNTVRARDIVYQPNATHFQVTVGAGRDHVAYTTALAGEFNVRNALAAIAAAYAFGAAGWLSLSAQAIDDGLRAVKGVEGRLERIDAGQPFTALVDFAHTPNALVNALQAARTMTKPGGRVIVVFGCAGLRDREKRTMMPASAIRLADLSIFTAEDPRTEPLDAILATMREAAQAAGGVEGTHFAVIADRGAALARAVAAARPGDVVIACGKGHEQSMAFGTAEYPWDDRAALRAAIAGAPLATLPTAARHDPAGQENPAGPADPAARHDPASG